MKRRIKTMNRIGMFVVLLIVVMGLQGCATAPLHNDYFGHATELKPDPEDVSLLWWEKPGFNWHKYSKILLDPVNIQINEENDKPTGYPIQRIKRRRTVKHGQLRKEISSKDVKVLSKSLGERLFYFPTGSKHATCIRDAAVENYRIQAQRDDAQIELIRWLRLSDQDARLNRDGLSTEGMEIQGLKGWYVRHFVKPQAFLKESYRQQGIDLIADLVQQGAGWFILTSPGQTAEDLIETGRRFERMALMARELGIGIHPMMQILEEKQGIEHIVTHHGREHLPQFVLRVGYLETYAEPVSLRRPLEWFVTT